MKRIAALFITTLLSITTYVQAQTSSMTIESKLGPVEVYVDGSQLEYGQKNSFTFEGLNPGSHEIKINSSGMKEPLVFYVGLNPNEMNVYEFILDGYTPKLMRTSSRSIQGNPSVSTKNDAEKSQPLAGILGQSLDKNDKIKFDGGPVTVAYNFRRPETKNKKTKPQPQANPYANNNYQNVQTPVVSETKPNTQNNTPNQESQMSKNVTGANVIKDLFGKTADGDYRDPYGTKWIRKSKNKDAAKDNGQEVSDNNAVANEIAERQRLARIAEEERIAAEKRAKEEKERLARKVEEERIADEKRKIQEKKQKEEEKARELARIESEKKLAIERMRLEQKKLDEQKAEEVRRKEAEKLAAINKARYEEEKRINDSIRDAKEKIRLEEEYARLKKEAELKAIAERKAKEEAEKLRLAKQKQEEELRAINERKAQELALAKEKAIQEKQSKEKAAQSALELAELKAEQKLAEQRAAKEKAELKKKLEEEARKAREAEIAEQKRKNAEEKKLREARELAEKETRKLNDELAKKRIKDSMVQAERLALREALLAKEKAELEAKIAKEREKQEAQSRESENEDEVASSATVNTKKTRAEYSYKLNENCDRLITVGELQELFAKLEAKVDDDARINLVKKFVKKNRYCYLCTDIEQLSQGFDKQNGKFEFVMLMMPQIADTENHAIVEKIFSFESLSDQVKRGFRILNRKK